MLILRKLRRPSRRAFTRHLQVDMKARLRQIFTWLLVLGVLHVIAMVTLEGLSTGNAVWLTLTTLTTVGYGDFSAATTGGRLATTAFLYIAGITMMAQLASDYIDYRLKRKDDMIRGRWRWPVTDHLLIINSPNRNPEVYFQRLLGQLKETREYADTPIEILTTGFPDGLPASLREQGVVHYHGEGSDWQALSSVKPHEARAIILLASDEDSRISDSVNLDILLQLQDQCQRACPYLVVECVESENRRRAERLGASTTLRPIRAYPEMLVRSLVARGSEKVLENLFTHHDDHPVRYAVPVTGRAWADIACRLMAAGMGTLMAYVSRDGEVICHPAHDHVFDAQALIVMVREEAIPEPEDVRQCLEQPMRALPAS